MDQLNKRKFRDLCLQEYKIRQQTEEAARQEQEDKDNAERHQKLVTFLKLHLLDKDTENIEAEELGVEDATYQDDRFCLTVGSREAEFPIIAAIVCERCHEILDQAEVKDFAQIGFIMSQAKGIECPDCDDTPLLAHQPDRRI